jgi:hypothetical protein
MAIGKQGNEETIQHGALAYDYFLHLPGGCGHQPALLGDRDGRRSGPMGGHVDHSAVGRRVHEETWLESVVGSSTAGCGARAAC